MTGGTLEETPSPGLQAGRAQRLKQNRAENGGSSCRGRGGGAQGCTLDSHAWPESWEDSWRTWGKS